MKTSDYDKAFNVFYNILNITLIILVLIICTPLVISVSKPVLKSIFEFIANLF